MARPSEPERKRCEASRRAKEKAREEAVKLEKRVRHRVEGLLDEALSRSKAAPEIPDKAEILARLEESRQMALSCWPPQCQAAINAAAWQAKLLGYVVEQTMVGKPQEFANVQGDSEERQREVLERLRERVGSVAAERFVKAMRNEGLLIEAKAQAIADDENDE